jgi:formylglycine-generating enzyme required for sulfatase activity
MEDDHMSKHKPAFGFLLIAFIGCIPGSDTKAIPEVEMVSILLPGKTVKFSIGSNNEVDEKPAHEVIFTIPYAISKYEVSNKLFRLVINWALDKKYATLFDGDVWDPAKTFKYTGIKNLSEGTQDGLEIVNQKLEVKLVEDIRKSILIPADDFPVHGVTWYGACAFCNFISLMRGLEPVYNLSTWECDWNMNGYRLPTEAEWTYAAKADKHYRYAWGNELHKTSCTFRESPKYFSNGLTPVGFYDGTRKYGITTFDNASPLGIYDLTGNVWEWCWDWYGSAYYAASPPQNPRGPLQGEPRLPWSAQATRVWRGGGYLAPPEYLRVDGRWSACPDQCYGETGFRPAQTIQ